MTSLRSKLLAAFVLVALVGVATVALVANRVTTREFALYVSYGGQMRAQRLAPDAADYYARTGSWQGVESVLEVRTGQGPVAGRGQGVQSDPRNERVLIVDPQDKVVVDTQGELVGQLLETNYQERGIKLQVGGEWIGTLVTTSSDLTGHSELEERFLTAVNRAVWIAVLSVTVVAFVAAFVLSRQLVAPLRRLTAASEAMAAGDLSQRVEIETQDEIGELGRAFDRMADDLQQAERQRQQMTADIAHELRNPLSVIRGNLEAMLDGIYAADGEHLGAVYEETLLLQRLVRDLRLLSLADAGQLELLVTEVDVSNLLRGIVDSAQAIADDKEIDLALDLAPDEIVVQGDVDRLRQVIGNLISNALRYTSHGGQVVVCGWAQGERVSVAVRDSGPGIAPDDLPHVFDRFYRTDAARARASGGSGLGLAIARALVEAHGGTIEVRSTLGQGTTFVLSIPK
jgi:signal transduction histidine kinase